MTAASPAPTRALRPRPTQHSKKARSNSDTYLSMTSPQGSIHATDQVDSREASTCHTSAPTSTSPDGLSVDPSVVAVRGSVPPSPILKGRRFGGNSSFATTPRQGKAEWDGEIKELANVVRETAETANVPPPADPLRNVNANRVVVVDADALHDGSYSLGTNPLAVAGLESLHAAGHPLHLVSSRPAPEDQTLIAWLAENGLSIGVKDKDTFAAFWLVEPGESTTNDGKLRVFRAVNASLYITGSTGAAVSSLITSLVIDKNVKDTKVDKIDKAFPPIEPVTRLVQTNRPVSKVSDWEQAVQWVNLWDEAK